MIFYLSPKRGGVFLSLAGKGNDVHFLARARKRTKRTRIRRGGFDSPSPYVSSLLKRHKGNSLFPLDSLSGMLLGGQGAKFSLICRAVGIKIRGFGGISDEAQADARSPMASFFSGVPGFFLRPKKEMGYIRSPKRIITEYKISLSYRKYSVCFSLKVCWG